MIEKIRDLRSKVDKRISTYERALKVLDECKSDLVEVFELIGKLKSIDPQQFFKAISNLDSKEKAVLLDFVKRGEICMKLQDIQKKEPRYIN